MNMYFDFDNPTRIIFGRGKLNELKNCDLPGKKALLLISNGKSTTIYHYPPQLTTYNHYCTPWGYIMQG